MRALIIGGAGMLGHRLWQELRERMETFVTVRRRYADYAPLAVFDERRTIERVDAGHNVDLQRAFQLARPEVVFNAAGVVKQRPEAADAVGTVAINALLPHRLAALCTSAGSRLVHLSTDCVFSGRRGSYREDDVPDAGDLYGRSKLLGEVTGPGCLTIRTSMVGREIGSDRGLIEWFLARRGQTVPGFTRARFSGLTTPELSRLLATLATEHPELSGVWHVAGEPIAKYDLLRLLDEAFGLGAQILPDESVICDRTLDGGRFARATGYVPPSWETSIGELATDPTPYDSWRTLWTSTARDHSTASTS